MTGRFRLRACIGTEIPQDETKKVFTFESFFYAELEGHEAVKLVGRVVMSQQIHTTTTFQKAHRKT